MLYFIQTTHFYPIDFKKWGFKVINDDTLVLETDKSVWKSILLYDLGFGREKGFYRTPMVDKEELFLLAFPKSLKNEYEQNFNYWGSISVLLDNYCDYLLTKISKKLETDKNFVSKYENALIYIHSELNVSDDLIDRLADKKLASNCKKWKRLNDKYKIINNKY